MKGTTLRPNTTTLHQSSQNKDTLTSSNQIIYIVYTCICMYDPPSHQFTYSDASFVPQPYSQWLFNVSQDQVAWGMKLNNAA